jgi:hypothetical protein
MLFLLLADSLLPSRCAAIRIGLIIFPFFGARENIVSGSVNEKQGTLYTSVIMTITLADSCIPFFCDSKRETTNLPQRMPFSFAERAKRTPTANDARTCDPAM